MSDAVVKIGAVVDKAGFEQGMAAGSSAVEAATSKMALSFEELQGRVKRNWAQIGDQVREAAVTVGDASIKVAEATTALAEAKREEAAALRLSKNESVDSAAAARLLAAAQENVVARTLELKKAQLELAESTKAVDLGAEVQELAVGLGELFLVMEGINKIREAISSSIELGEAIHHASEKTGLAAETLSVLHYAAGALGGDFDGLTAAVAKMDKTIGQATEGNKTAGKFIQSLGLNANDLAGRTDGAEVAFRRFMQVLSDTEAPIERVHLAQGVLGKAGAAQIPILMALGENWDALTQKTKESGTYLSAEMVEKLADASRRFNDLKEKMVGASLALTDGFTPAFSQMLQVVSNGKGTFDAFNTAGAFVSKTLAFIASAGYTAASALEGLFAITEGGSLTKGGAKDIEAARDLFAKAQQMHDIAFGGPSAPKVESFLPEDKSPKPPRGGFEGIGDSGAAAAANKEAQLKLKADEAELAQLKLHGHVTAVAEMEFWAERIGAFKEGSEQYNAIAAKQLALATAGAERAAKAIAKARSGDTVGAMDDLTGRKEPKKDDGPAILAEGIAATDKWRKQVQEDIEETGERWAAYHAEQAKGQEIDAASARALTLAGGAANLASGQLSEFGFVNLVAAANVAAHTAKLKALENELVSLKATGAKLKPGDLGYEENQKQQVGAENRIKQESGSSAVSAKQDSTAIANAMAKPYLVAFNQIETGWMAAQRQMLSGQKSFAQAMKQMWSGIATSAIENIEKVGFNMARNEIIMTARKAAAKAQQTTIDASGAAASMAISKTKNAETGLDDAKGAFRGTYNVVSHWPVVGPVLAPVLAAGAFAAVAAFEQGTMQVPRMGMAMLHPGEAVLGSPSAAEMRNALNGGGNRGGGDTHNYHFGGNNFSAAGTDTPGQMRKFERHIAKKFGKRNGTYPFEIKSKIG